MIFHATKLPGAYTIEPELIADVRGFFARTWCQREFAAHGLETALVQCNTSFSARRGTLRGMHYQLPPSAETKLVRCTQGAIYDVIVDLRPDSPTFLQSLGVELSATNRLMLYVPKGFAHGFLTLADATEVFYQMTEFYAPEHARGLRWNDPLLQLWWPEAVQVIAERDASYLDGNVADLAPLRIL